jgi:ABC-2 type transport system permease protein
MNKIWIIIQREYVTRVKRPAFLLTTLLAPVGFLLLMVASVAISTMSSGNTKVAVIDDSGIFNNYFKEHNLADAEDGTVHFFVVNENFDSVAASLSAAKEDEAKYSAVIHIPSAFNVESPQKPGIVYMHVERPGIVKQQFVNARFTEVLNKIRMQQMNISDTLQAQMEETVKLQYVSLKNAEEKSGYGLAAGIAGLVMGFAIYISLFFYGTMIMKGVQEEKTNRIVEVLTSSVKPFQLLMGKILGVGAVGLTQFVLWILLTFFVNLFVLPVLGITMSGSAPSPAMQGGAEIDPESMQSMIYSLRELPFTQIIILFPLYFLGGFLLYGSLFAAVGAAMGEDSDQQSLMIPITLPIIISIFIAMNVVNNPDSNLGFWGSLVPFSSPIVMSALLPFHQPVWKVVLSLVLLIAGFVFTTFIAARIYRTGILMYGKKVKFTEILRWIFSKG